MEEELLLFENMEPWQTISLPDIHNKQRKACLKGKKELLDGRVEYLLDVYFLRKRVVIDDECLYCIRLKEWAPLSEEWRKEYGCLRNFRDLDSLHVLGFDLINHIDRKTAQVLKFSKCEKFVRIADILFIYS